MNIRNSQIDKQSPLIGRKVRIKELDQKGTVHTVLKSGEVAQVEVDTPSGPQLVNTLQYTIVVIGLLGQLVDLISDLVKKIRINFFSKKDSK